MGIDGSQKMLDIAVKKAPNVEVARGDLEKLPLRDKSFDAVVLKHILEHQPDGYENVVSEALRIARKCVIIDFFHPPLTFGPKTVRIFDKKGYANNWYRKRDFERFISNVGIK